MKKGQYFQQGDIIIEFYGKAPVGLKKLVHRVLAMGEATGHKHEIIETELSDLYVDKNGNLFLHTSKEVTVKHNTHDPIKIPALKPDEVYSIRHVLEYDHFLEESKKVQD